MQSTGPTIDGAIGVFQDLCLKLRTLSVFRGVLEDDLGELVLTLLDTAYDQSAASGRDFGYSIETFGRLVGGLLSEAVSSRGASTGDLWQDYLLNRVLSDSNPFSLLAEKDPRSVLSGALVQPVQRELRILQPLHAFSLSQMHQALLEAFPQHRDLLGELQQGWDGLVLGRSAHTSQARAGYRIKKRLAAARDWGDVVSDLAQYYADAGTGPFSRFYAFRWVLRDDTGSLEGIAEPDPVRPEDLVGYEQEKEIVLRNTRRFVQGAPGNNVLLYGDAGTGKSSLVKALLNTFGDQGLRLIEIPKERLQDFPYVARQLRGRKERFILFVDDFSFEEQETEYKALKALLEGSLEARPENVLVYATSNRRNLVREHFSDRATSGAEDVHPHETVQEKLSLADRFGIRVAFPAPNQERYLTIVEALARRERVLLDGNALGSRAMQWAQWQHGYSGRTARQFIDDLVGELTDTGDPSKQGSVDR